MDIWNILFVIAAAQGLFLAVILYFGRGKHTYANKILSLFIVLFSLNTLENVAYWTNYQLQIPHVINSTRAFVFLFGPLLWFYTAGVTREQWKMQWKDVLHFVPFVIIVISRLPFYLLSAAEKRELVLSDTPTNPSLQLLVQIFICVHLGVYSLLMLNDSRKRNVSVDVPISTLHTGIGLSIYTLTFVAYYLMVYTIDLKPEYDYVLSLIGVVAIYQIGYLAIAKPELLHGFKRKEIQVKKYEKSALTEEEAHNYQQQIQDLLEKDKIYLTPDVRLSDFGDRLGVSTNHISQVINEHFGKTFNELLTEYRVREAVRRLDDPDNDEKLLSIALNSGFNNRTSFNQSFKKHVGCSPKEYKEKARV